MTNPSASNPSPGRRLESSAAAIICVGAALLGIWLLFRYAFGVVTVFLLAWLLSRIVRPVVDKLCRRRRIPRGPVAAVGVVLIAGGVIALAVSGIRRGIRELSHFVEAVVADEDGLLAAVDSLTARIESVTTHLPGLRHLRDHENYAALAARIDALVADAIARLGEALGDRLPGIAMSVAAGVPGALLYLTVLLLACYYFTADNGRLRQGLSTIASRLLPPSVCRALPPIGRRLARLGKGYLRATLLLGGLTFLLCFIGLTLLGVRYAFLIGILLAVVDILPLLGTGVILVPWAAIAALLGYPGMAVGLGVLWGVCTLVRQLAEPRLMGQGLDIHPLASLGAMYAGLVLFGIPGMLAAPFLAAGVKVVLFASHDAAEA